MRPLTGHEHHGRKKHHGADHRKQDWLEDLPHTPKSGLFAGHPFGLGGMYRFTDDNRIVHHNAQHQEEGEQRDHIESDAGVRQQEKRA